MSLRDKLPDRLLRALRAGRYHVVPSIDGRASNPDLGRTEVQRGAGDLGGSGSPPEFTSDLDALRSAAAEIESIEGATLGDLASLLLFLERSGWELARLPESGSGGEGDADRLYHLLALFDRRDGSALAELVQRAREGYERSHPDMGESENRHAWDAFDSLWDSLTMQERLKLRFAAPTPTQEAEVERRDAIEAVTERLAERYYSRSVIDESYQGDEEAEASRAMRRAREQAKADVATGVLSPLLADHQAQLQRVATDRDDLQEKLAEKDREIERLKARADELKRYRDMMGENAESQRRRAEQAERGQKEATVRWAEERDRAQKAERERDEWKARYRREKKQRKKANGRARHWKGNHGQQVRRVRQIDAELKAAEQRTERYLQVAGRENKRRRDEQPRHSKAFKTVADAAQREAERASKLEGLVEAAVEEFERAGKAAGEEERRLENTDQTPKLSRASRAHDRVYHEGRRKTYEHVARLLRDRLQVQHSPEEGGDPDYEPPDCDDFCKCGHPRHAHMSPFGATASPIRVGRRWMAERHDVRRIPVDAAQIAELRVHDDADILVYAPCLDESDPPESGEGPCAKCSAYLPLRGAIRQILADYDAASPQEESRDG